MGAPRRLLFLTLLVATAIGAGRPSKAEAVDGRLLGGQEAAEGLAPYQASLQTLPGDHLCGGAVVGRRWVLTAGHCVSGWPAGYLRVAVGSNRYREPGAVHHLEAIHVHPGRDRPRYANDVALLQLNGSIEFDERTQAVALPERVPAEGAELLLTGWGAEFLGGGVVESLRRVFLRHVGRDECRRRLAEFEDLELGPGHVCAFERIGAGGCHGDSGAPLVDEEGRLVGVATWSRPCATGVPDVFANVLYFREWMRRVMSGNQRC